MLEGSAEGHADAYVYVIANTFPDSDIIRESPPFDITLNYTIDGNAPVTNTYKVNQWGGLTVKQAIF